MNDLAFFPISSQVNGQGELTIAGHDLTRLAEQYNTPLYLFDAATLRGQANSLKQLLAKEYPGESLVAYAAKAYFSLGIARKLAALDLGVDVVSLGEFNLALKAGFTPDRIHLHGNNKSRQELEMALDLNIQAVAIDSLDELALLEKLAAAKQRKARIWLRITGEFGLHTHAHIDTSGVNSKFGLHLANGQAVEALRQARASRWLDLVGLHTHLGSMLFEPEAYQQAIQAQYRLAEAEGTIPAEISPGGGWGVRYNPADPDDGYAAWVKVVSATVQAECARLGWPLPRLVLEPGRSLVGRAGVAIYRVGACKTTPSGLNIVAVDGGIADNPRYALYQAQYSARLVKQAASAPMQDTRVVGKFCESGDVLIASVRLPAARRDDLLSVPVAGAYQLSMASNYNLAPRPAVLWLEDQSMEVLQAREQPDQSGWWV
jgi:diaminopimelate decarboxylase